MTIRDSSISRGVENETGMQVVHKRMWSKYQVIDHEQPFETTSRIMNDVRMTLDFICRTRGPTQDNIHSLLKSSALASALPVTNPKREHEQQEERRVR